MQEVRDLVDEVLRSGGIGRGKRPVQAPIRRPRDTEQVTFQETHAAVEARRTRTTFHFHVDEILQHVRMALEPLPDGCRVIRSDSKLGIRDDFEPCAEMGDGNVFVQCGNHLLEQQVRHPAQE